ncbi:MAG: DUF4097 family beta strand repeat-containing protein [Gemmatimonadaceae bacterium]
MMRRSNSRAGTASSALFAGLVLFSGAASAQASERHTLAGSEVAIYNLAGSIRVEGASSEGDVVVEVRRMGNGGDRLKVATGQVRGRETLRVIFPERDIVFRREGERRWGGETRVRVNDDGTFGDNGKDRWNDRDEVEIRSSGRGYEGYAEVRVLVPKGKRVDLHLAVGDASASNVDGDFSFDVSAATVTTTKTRGSLSLDTGSGEVNVSDAEGELRLDSGSGSVTLTRVKGDHLVIDSGSGSVRGNTLDSDELSLDSGSGRIRLEAVRARTLDIDSGSGSVELQLLSDVDHLRADAGSGSVTLGIPESLGAELHIDSGSGGIDIDIPISITHRDRDSLNGKIGDGRGKIEIDAGSGGVRLRRS